MDKNFCRWKYSAETAKPIKGLLLIADFVIFANLSTNRDFIEICFENLEEMWDFSEKHGTKAKVLLLSLNQGAGTQF